MSPAIIEGGAAIASGIMSLFGGHHGGMAAPTMAAPPPPAQSPIGNAATNKPAGAPSFLAGAVAPQQSNIAAKTLLGA